MKHPLSPQRSPVNMPMTTPNVKLDSKVVFHPAGRGSSEKGELHIKRQRIVLPAEAINETEDAEGLKPDQLASLRTPPRDLHRRFVVQMTNCRILRRHRLVKEDLWIENGVIIDPQGRFYRSSSHQEFRADLVVDGRGAIIAPGFIDIQLNGAFGVDFSDSDCDQSYLRAVGRGLLKYGVTSFCPTIVSSSAKKYHKILPKLSCYTGDAAVGASVLGLHLEGPFMSPEKKGAHNPQYVAAPSEGIESIVERYGSLENVKIITLAPELNGALSAIKELTKRGIIVSMGHSMANFDQSLAGYKAGASMVTHMFNAMPTFHHRDPGLVGLLGTKEAQPFYGIIADGIHTHPSSVKIAYQAHPGGLVLVTDAMQAMGLPSGRHKLGDLDVEVNGCRAVISGTQTLAGSAVSMDHCVREFRRSTGCSTVEALEAASLQPARALGIEKKKGSLEPGSDADLVLLNDKLEVLATFVAGQLAYGDDRRVFGSVKEQRPSKTASPAEPKGSLS